MMVGLCGVQFFMILIWVKRHDLSRPDDEKRKEAAKAWLKERKTGVETRAPDERV